MTRLLSFLLLLLLLTACTTAQLDLPGDAWTVEGANPRWWNQPISFGPYRTAVVNEGTTRSWLADLEILEVAKTDQAYRLTLNDVAVECHTREIVIGRAGVFVDPSFGREPLLVCGYEDEDARSVLTLARTGRPEPTLRGEIRGEGRAIEVRSLHRAGSSLPSSEPFGYEFVRGGRRVGIVETINRGRVWIDPDDPDRDTLAAAAASLLLFRDPDAGG